MKKKLIIRKLLNKFNINGKKNISYKIMYTFVNTLEFKNKENYKYNLNYILKNFLPLGKIKTIKIAGKKSAIPLLLNKKEKTRLSMKYFNNFLLKNSKNTLDTFRKNFIYTTNYKKNVSLDINNINNKFLSSKFILKLLMKKNKKNRNKLIKRLI